MDSSETSMRVFFAFLSMYCCMDYTHLIVSEEARVSQYPVQELWVNPGPTGSGPTDCPSHKTITYIQ